MANKTKSTQLGDYVCKIGKYDIRHQISQPNIKKNQTGSVTAGTYLGKTLVKGGFDDHSKAIQYAWGRLKKSGESHHVKKQLVEKYNLS
jgi:hypothetical protein